MVFDVMAMLIVGLAISFFSGAESAQCPSGTFTTDVTSATDVQTLTGALACTGEGTFNITWYRSLTIAQTIEVSNNKKVTITGVGFPSIRGTPADDPSAGDIIDAAGGSGIGIFSVSNGSTLSLTHVILAGGIAEHGGAVDLLSSSSLFVFSCAFTNNSASNGGAIYSSSSAIYVAGNTSFSYNSATFGVLRSKSMAVHYFSRNTADGDGGRSRLDISHLPTGAIDAKHSEVHINGTANFCDNSATVGGAMSAYDSAVYISGTTSFSDNSVGGARGVVYANGSKADINGDKNFGDNSIESYGGALSMDHSTVYVDGSSYCESNFAVYGGAIYAYESDVRISGKSLYAHNLALKLGGAMHVNGSEVSINGNTQFSDNSAVRYGGALSVDHSDVYIKGTTLVSSNFANQGGGAIHAHDGSQVIVDGNNSFADNSVVSYGGAMYFEVGCVVSIDGNTQFFNNSAVFHAGAVYAALGCVVNMDGNTLFADNSARFRGGGIHQSESNLTIGGNASFVTNSAGFGANVCTESHDYTTLQRRLVISPKRCPVCRQQREIRPRLGAVHIPSPAPEYDVLEPSGIYSADSSLIVSSNGSAWFTGNDATADGGAISMTGPTQVQITHVTFTSNTAKAGGAISLESPVENRRVYEDCMFYGNTATDGGGVSLYGGAGVDYFASCVFRDNSAVNGGAAYIIGTLYTTMASSSFLANKAEEEGMAIFLEVLSESSKVEVTNILFADNAYRCPLGQYGYDSTAQNVSRIETVCKGCATVTNVVSEGVQFMNPRAKPSCAVLPEGTIGLSSGTSIESITLQKGFFRTSNKSSAVIECYRTEACEGGSDPSKYCADGYEGAYCSVCADGFSRGIAYSCRECSKEARGSAIVFALTGAVFMLLVATVLLRSLATAADGEQQDFARSKCASCQGYMMKILPLSAIQIVVVVWQIIYQFSSIAEAVYPSQYETFLSYISFTTFDMGVILWYSCLFSPDFHARLLLATISPLVVLSILAGAYYIAKDKYINSNRGKLVVRNQHLAAALFVVFFVYSSVSSTILQTFRCDLLDDSIEHLQADYSLTCSSAKHKSYMVYASLMFIVYPVGIPALFCWWLVRNRMQLKLSHRQSIAHLKPFNSIWGTYRPSRYYYEVVECCRRITLSAASVFLIPNSVNQIAVVLSLALVFLFVSESLSPFERNVDMSLYRWGNGVILASMYVALLMKANASDGESERLSVLGRVLITANVVMIVAIFVQSVLLAHKWRTSMTITEEIVPPVARHLLAATKPGSTVMLNDDWWKQSFTYQGQSRGDDLAPN